MKLQIRRCGNCGYIYHWKKDETCKYKCSNISAYEYDILDEITISEKDIKLLEKNQKKTKKAKGLGFRDLRANSF